VRVVGTARGFGRAALLAAFATIAVVVAQVADAPISVGVPPPEGILWQDRFDTAAPGPLTTAGGNGLFDPRVGKTDAVYAHAAITADAGGEKFLRHTIPAGELGNFFAAPRLVRDVEHATLQYDIRFDEGFDWRWGGKIPGLAGVAPGVEIYAPTSGERNRDVGFSTRLMWHGRADDGSRAYQDALGAIPPDQENMLVTYAYVRSPEDGFGGYGWQTNLDAGFRAGVWHNVRMEVKLNTIGRADGVYRVWIDDILRFSASDWDYRNRADVKIQAVLYDIHRGGNNSPGWVSSRESSIDLRHITVTEAR
jgi:hypothetical protein